MPEAHDEPVSVFDVEGRAVGALPREEAMDLTRSVVFVRVALQLNVRDVRIVAEGGTRNVVMAFLWLTHARALLALAGGGA